METRGQAEVRGHARRHTNIRGAGFCSGLIVVEPSFGFFFFIISQEMLHELTVVRPGSFLLYHHQDFSH